MKDLRRIKAVVFDLDGTLLNTLLDIGAGAAVGVVVALLVLLCYLIMNKVFKEEALEY